MINKNVFDPGVFSSRVCYYRLGRHAFLAALNMLGLQPGEKILLPAIVCRDLLAAVHAIDGVPVFYEVGQDMGPIAFPVEKVRAVIAVNYFGFPQDLSLFRKYCADTGAILIEDNAHGFLSCDVSGALLGTRGDIGFFSIRKTFAVPDGALLMVNDATLRNWLPEQLPFRKGSLSPGFFIQNGLRWLQKNIGINFLMMGRRAARLIRYVRTGYFIAPMVPESEFEMPGMPEPHMYLLKVLPKFDQEKEISRRRKLYHTFHSKFASIGIQPVFDSLPEGVAPYGYPFFATGEALQKARSIAGSMGLDCIPWPDLPNAIEKDALFHYRSLLIVNFIC